MKRYICLIALFCGVYGAQAQLNDFSEPFKNGSNVEPSRSEFISYRRTSGTKGSPIDPALSYSLINDFSVKTSAGQSVASAEFVVPFDFMDKALFLNVGAASGAVSVYINDKFVGKRSDSKLASEFNISKFVERGVNRLKIIAQKEGDVSKIEQSDVVTVDFGKVYLFAQPKIRIFDITTRTSLDPTYKNGLLEIALLLKTELLNPHEVTVYYDLYDASGKLVNQASKDVKIDMRVQDTVRFTATIFDVKKWSHENPYLYTVEFRIKREGRFTETLWRKVGFRMIEATNKQMLINGFAPQIIGMNAGTMPILIDPVANQEDLVENLTELKFTGINAIRTPFPLRGEFYDICDSLGFYVFETTNINSKSASKSIMKGGTLANNPAWRDIFVERAVNTYERAKVHPSVIAIGLGSDAGNGYNMYQAYNAIRKRDITRLIVNDDAKAEWNTDINMFEINEKAVQPTILAKVDDFSVLDRVQGAFLNKGGNITELSSIVGNEFRPIEFEAINPQKGIYRLTNNMKTTNLSELQCTYEIVNSNGKVTKGGSIIVDLPAKESVDIEIAGTAGKTIIIKFGKVATFQR